MASRARSRLFLSAWTFLLSFDSVDSFLSKDFSYHSQYGRQQGRATADKIRRHHAGHCWRLPQSAVDTAKPAKDVVPADPTARLLVVKALMPRKGSGAFAVERFESMLGFQQLDLRDRSFGRLLLSTTERRLGQIDAILAACEQKNSPSRRKRSQLDILVQSVLRIGAVQLLFLQVPSHAAVKETVDVLRMHSKIKVPETRIKFVNAVLRRLSREGTTLLETTTAADNLAPWLRSELESTWGLERTEQILNAAMEESPRCLTIRHDGSTNGRDLQAQTEWVASHFPETRILSNGSLQIVTPPTGPISSWPLYAEGSWWLQDPSATLPAIALLHGLQSQHDTLEGHAVVDLCAAPGGKTAQLANDGRLNVTAVEVSAQRSKRLGQNQARLQLEWTTVVADGTKWMPSSTTAGTTTTPLTGVLLDAPCTATGTASKRPDVLRREEDFSELLQVQYDLACHASDALLQPGGILVYATCSLLKQESEDQITKLLKRQDGARLETLPFEKGEIPGFDSAIDANGWLRVLPGSLSDGLERVDGFFVARLRKLQ